jgi:hypothetical protein
MSLDYRPMLLSHQLFRETVPLKRLNAGKIFVPRNYFEMPEQWFKTIESKAKLISVRVSSVRFIS